MRLVDRVPILETEKVVQRFMDRVEYRPRLAKHAIRVCEGSAQQFSADDQGLVTLLHEVSSMEYIVTKRSKRVMEDMLADICDDGRIFKDFEVEIGPLYDVSQPLREVSKVADSLADKTKEESLDLARALLIRLPTQNEEPAAA